MSRIIAIDQSTSATKAILFSDRGVVLDKAVREHRQIYPRAGWVEHDAEEIWSNTLATLRELAAKNADQLAAVTALSITNQRETIVVFDRETGRPLHNAIVWQCRRGDELCSRLRDQGHAETVQRKTGLRIDSYFSASKLNWLIEETPDLAAKLRSGTALIGTIDTYLIYRLTGGQVFATDSTNACRTLLYDIERLRWDEELCALFGVPMQALPEVRECTARFGQTNALGILPSAVPICGVMGDSQASLFAQACYEPGTAKATFGTGTSLMVNAGPKWRPSNSGVVSSIAWVCHTEPTYAFEGLINYAAATIAWLQNGMQLIAGPAETEVLANSVDDTGGVYLVPAFAGLSAPYWSANAKAAIVGMTGSTTKAHVVRAALESISFQIRDVLDMMRRDAGIEVRSLRVDGGPTRNAFLMQFTADITGVELVVADVPESSSLGATLAGLMGMGVYPQFEDLAALKSPGRVYRPSMDAATVSRLHAGWTAAVHRIL